MPAGLATPEAVASQHLQLLPGDVSCPVLEQELAIVVWTRLRGTECVVQWSGLSKGLLNCLCAAMVHSLSGKRIEVGCSNRIKIRTFS